jgi:KaiC/GvpD/RAD55 family RecA-like ATPase
MSWDSASGLAIINGPGGWHSLDIDQCDNPTFIDELLDKLDLPSDYPWVVKSGSGYHIWFQSSEQSDRTCKEFDCTDPRCKQIELRWAGCYTVVPPSKHPSGSRYTFENGEPDSIPRTVSSQAILDAISEFTKVSAAPTDTATAVHRPDGRGPWDGDPDVVEDALCHVADALGPPPDYDEWLKVTSAVVDGVGEDRGIEMLEEHFPPIDADGNDYQKKRGKWLDEVGVGTLFHQAKENGWEPPWTDSHSSGPDPSGETPSSDSSGIPSPVSAATVEPAKISWLWDEYVAEGMVHLLDGDPGTGKSTFLLGLAAAFSRGETPDGESISPMTTLYISGEDPADTVLVPRFQAAGGNLDRLQIHGASTASAITFPSALPDIQAQIEAYGAKLCVVDPFFSLLDRDYSKNAEQDVREVLNELTDVADETDCTFLLVRHFNKKEDSSPLYRGGGSIGITAQARLAYAFLPHPKNDDERVLAWEKNNISKKDQTESLIFEMKGIETEDVGEQPVVELDRTESMTAQEIMDGKGRGRPAKKRNRAKALIKGKLQDGSRCPAGAMCDLIDGEDLSKKTLERAAEKLGVEKENDGGTWYWSLPEEEQGYDLEPSDDYQSC